jgi:uncharacterized protein
MRRAAALLVVACFAVLCTAQPAAADTMDADPVADPAHRASMMELSIPSHGDALYGVFYEAAGAGPHATVVLLHGFAGFEQNADLAQSMRRAGWNVLIFHYRGAWGSQGAFSFHHCIEDVEEVLRYLRTSTNAQVLGVDPKRIVLVGHSVGGFLAGYVAATDTQVAAVAMISAANRHVAMSRPDFAVQTSARFRNELGPLRGTSAETLVAELGANAAQWDLVRLAPRWAPRPVLIVSADDIFSDESAAIVAAAGAGGVRSLTQVHLATDHVYSDQRLALARTLRDWLAQLPAAPQPP